jgi:TolB-like protein/Flp pilus assembly protein TadD
VYDLPEALFKVVAVLMTCGAASAFIVAWYHGSGGTQKTQKKEYAFHTLVLAAAIILSFRVTGLQKAIVRLPDDRTIAVLPFKNLSDNKEDEYFSIGMTDDILTQLSKIKDLRVISRTSVMKYKNTERTIREIGGELGAATILEGSVRRAGNRVRIVSQLINAQTDEHLWGETYDREMRDVFAIQSEVAQRIVTALEAKLSPEELQRIDRKPTENLDAYAYYLRGRELYYRYTKDDNEQAIDLFKKSIALDSAYALAYAGLGDAYAQRVQRFSFPDAWNDSSLALAQQAIVLDPNIAEPYKALGLAYYQHGWLQKAMEQYRSAIELSPNFASPVANLSRILRDTGRLAEALPLMQKSIILNAGRATYYFDLGLLYVYMADDSLAEHWLRYSMRIQPDLTFPYSDLAKLYATQGKLNEAKELMDQSMTKAPDDPYVLVGAGEIALWLGSLGKAKQYFQRASELYPVESKPTTQLAFIAWKEGRQAETDRLLAQSLSVLKKYAEEGNEDCALPYDSARILVIQGKKHEACQLLSKAVDAGWRQYRWTAQEPLFESLRGNPDFVKLIQYIKSLVDEERRISKPPMDNF